MPKEPQPQLKLEPPVTVCAGCNESTGTIQYVAICQRGRLEVHNAYLHPQCERTYLERIEPA